MNRASVKFEDMINTIQLGDCKDVLKNIPDNSVDMVLTSPPYDELRNYNNSLNWDFDIFKQIAQELVRTLKEGGVIIWVVGDSTVNGSESLTSFKQAIYFNELGLNVYDTMIYRKLNFMPLTHRRYEQEFEYMFCFSKGIPKTFNPIMENCKYAGTTASANVYKTNDDMLTSKGIYTVKEEKIKGNIFEYHTGSLYTGEWEHPAMFPYKLAEDQINSWTNESDIVLDPFSGSGTTCLASKRLSRKFIGIEKVERYYKMSLMRINEMKANGQLSIFSNNEGM